MIEFYQNLCYYLKQKYFFFGHTFSNIDGIKSCKVSEECILKGHVGETWMIMLTVFITQNYDFH